MSSTNFYMHVYPSIEAPAQTITSTDNQVDLTVTGKLSQTEPSRKYPQRDSRPICPNCGYCPHCGRGGHYAYPYYPTYPSNPWITYTSNGTYCSNQDPSQFYK